MKKIILSFAIALIVLSSYAADYYRTGDASSKLAYPKNWVGENDSEVTRPPGPDDRIHFADSGNACIRTGHVPIPGLLFNGFETHTHPVSKVDDNAFFISKV